MSTSVIEDDTSAVWLGASVTFLGEDLLEWLVLAFGGAMAVGNLGAVVRPRPEQRDGDLVRAPIARSLVMGTVGLVAAVWALASLAS